MGGRVGEGAFRRRWDNRVRTRHQVSKHRKTNVGTADTYSQRVVESQVPVQGADGLDLAGFQVPASDVQVLRQAVRVVALGDDSDVALRGPAQQHLGRGLAVLLGNALDGRMLEQDRGLLRILHLQLEEALRTEGGISGHSNALLLGIFNESRLRQVRVVLDLEGSRADARIAQQVHDQLDTEVADANAAGEALVDQRLHGRPCLLDRGIAEFQLFTVAGPAWRVSDGGVDIFQGNGEVDEVQVEVVDTPVRKLLAADGLDLVALVEGVPQLGNDEEILALHNAFLDGTGNTLASLNLIAVV